MSLIQSQALRFMQQAEYDLVLAKRIAHEEVPKDPALLRMLWQQAIDATLENVWRSGREVHWKRAEGVTAPNSADQRRVTVPASPAPPQKAPTVLRKGETSEPSPALMRATSRVLSGAMLFEMPRGTHIGQWTKAELDALADKVISQSRSGLATGYFFKAVAGMLKRSTDRVCDVLTNNDLERLMRQQGVTHALPQHPV